jgi:hypothetical protein
MRSSLISLTPVQVPAPKHPWGFLTYWSFYGTLATFVGFVLGAVGLVVAFRQIRKTLRAAQAAAGATDYMWHQQLIFRLDSLAEISIRLDQCADEDNRREMKYLLGQWLRVASEVQGLIEEFEDSSAQSVNDIRAELALPGYTAARTAPFYIELQTSLVKAINLAADLRQQIEKLKRSTSLSEATATCRSAIRDVTTKATKVQSKLRIKMTGRNLVHGS